MNKIMVGKYYTYKVKGILGYRKTCSSCQGEQERRNKTKIKREGEYK